MVSYATPEGRYYPFCRDYLLDSTHLLIAGGTGTGKSNLLHAFMRDTLLHSPAFEQFILIDLKRVELSIYKDLPHTMGYANELNQTNALLDTAIALMESRYHLCEQKGLRHINEGERRASDVWVIFDEFADVILGEDKKVAKECVRKITRLITKARASAIHIVICTQLPSRQVLPANITSNINYRVALHCDSRIESAQILGAQRYEATALPKYGECIYKTPNGFYTADIPLTDMAEVQERINYWSEDNKAVWLLSGEESPDWKPPELKRVGLFRKRPR